jgi:hypothetical protein
MTSRIRRRAVARGEHHAGMRRRASDQVAEQAVVLLLQDGLAEMGESAFLRRTVSHTRAHADDYHAHIRMLAEIGHHLPAAFRPGRFNARETLQLVWNTSDPLKREWIEQTLEVHDIAIGEVLGFEV